MQPQLGLARPRGMRARPDLVPWLAGLALLSLLATIAIREGSARSGHPLPAEVDRAAGLAVWWIYWGSVVFFGLAVIRCWRNTYFRWRTAATMVSQTFFGVLLAGPLKAHLGVPPLWQRLHLTWPLHPSVITPYQERTFPIVFAYGVIVSLIAWPLISYLIGMRYCSWFCFCGNLAESLGDSFRTKGPKGPNWQSADSIAYLILAAAAACTALLWAPLAWPFQWYDLIVGLLLADIIGLGLYPVLGSRVWCRFFCPLRAMLGWYARRGRFAIYTSDQRCIECGTCNRYCEMGIDVRLRARQGVPLRDTECVACGACIAVCPRYALSFYPFPTADQATAARNVASLRRPFRRQLATPRES